MSDTELFSDKELFDHAHNGYLLEINHLVQIANTPDFRKLLEAFKDYSDFLSLYSNEAKNSQNIDFSKPSKDLLSLTHLINLAAACDLFASLSLPTADLNTDQLIKHFEQSIGHPHEQGTKNIARMLARKLNSGDASRVIHMLKLLGWIAPDMTNTHQLSLGASGGTRDRASAHQLPVIRYQPFNPLLRNPDPESVHFDVTQHTPSDVVLVDNAPEMKRRYQELNKTPSILALNLDASDALTAIKEQIDAGQLAPRSFVLAFRIDHRMIPDSIEFLRQIGSVIDSEADLVITIGAGHTNQEFKGRLEKIKELSTALTGAGLNPRLVKWYRGKTLSEQRNNPVFGALTYTTYEILYCKLDKSSLIT